VSNKENENLIEFIKMRMRGRTQNWIGVNKYKDIKKERAKNVPWCMVGLQEMRHAMYI